MADVAVRPFDPSALSLVDRIFGQVVSLDALMDGAEEGDGGPGFDIPDAAAGVDEQVELAMAITAVQDFVLSLSEREQLIVYRVFYMDETQTAVAESLGVTKMAVSKAISKISARGRTALAQFEHIALRT